MCALTDGDYYNGSVSVLNGCRLKTPDGKIDSITGHAYRPDEKEQGKLKVVFDGYSTARDCKCLDLCGNYVHGDWHRLGCTVGSSNV